MIKLMFGFLNGAVDFIAQGNTIGTTLRVSRRPSILLDMES